jgi:hypothetical protein
MLQGSIQRDSCKVRQYSRPLKSAHLNAYEEERREDNIEGNFNQPQDLHDVMYFCVRLCVPLCSTRPSKIEQNINPPGLRSLTKQDREAWDLLLSDSESGAQHCPPESAMLNVHSSLTPNELPQVTSTPEDTAHQRDSFPDSTTSATLHCLTNLHGQLQLLQRASR